MSHNLPSLGRPYEEMKRTSRILELVQIMAVAPRRYLRRDLAQRFEVSEGTWPRAFSLSEVGSR